MTEADWNARLERLLRPFRSEAAAFRVLLATIAVFYFLVGLALLAGARAAVEAIGPALETTPAYVVQLALGVGLFVLSFVIDPKAVAKRRAARGRSHAT